MKTVLPELPIVDIALIDGVIYHVTVQVDGVRQITCVSSADYNVTWELAEAVAEGVMAVTGHYPVMAHPSTEIEWRQAHPETEEPAETVQYATEPAEYWSES